MRGQRGVGGRERSVGRWKQEEEEREREQREAAAVTAVAEVAVEGAA